MEQPIVFTAQQEQLHGILHLPEQPRQPSLGIVFAHFGARGRLGSTFFYNYAARQLAKEGYPCMRFDPEGMGDSSGLPSEVSMPDFYGSVQSGRYVTRTLTAIDIAKRSLGTDRIVMFGVCGGAITSLLAAPRSQHVDGLILLSLPVLLDSAHKSVLNDIPAGYARQYLMAAYARKLLSPAAWLRFASGKSDFATISMHVGAVLKGVKTRLQSTLAQRGASTQPQAWVKNERFNEDFFEAFNAMVARRAKMILLFGRADSLCWDFERDFYEPYWNSQPAIAEQCEVHFLERCNHLFTLREWHDQALDIIRPWLASF